MRKRSLSASLNRPVPTNPKHLEMPLKREGSAAKLSNLSRPGDYTQKSIRQVRFSETKERYASNSSSRSSIRPHSEYKKKIQKIN